MKKLSCLATSLLFASLTTLGQMYSEPVDWASTSATTYSSESVEVCIDTILIELTTTNDNHDLTTSGDAAGIPANSATSTPTIGVQIEFSQPVTNLRLKLSDIDEYRSGGSDVGSPIELLTDFSPSFTGIASVSGSPTYVATGSNDGVDPNGNNDTEGWVYWNGPVTQINFNYQRTDGPYCAMHFKHIEFDLPEGCGDCDCSADLNTFESSPSTIPSNGAASVGLNINSNGEYLSRLSVTLPSFVSNVANDCFSCNAQTVGSIGHITSLPSIGGVTPTFVGASSSSSSEIVYEFTTPQIVDETIYLDVQFPETLDLECCSHTVDYCFKITQTKPDCSSCDVTICTNDRSRGAEKAKSKINRVESNPINEANKDESKLKVSPNPTTGRIKVELPISNGQLEIFSTDGKSLKQFPIKRNVMNIDVSDLERGNYIIKVKNENQSFTKKFIKS